MSEINYSKLSKEVSYALRHAPWEFELELDLEGWVPIEELLHALHQNKQWESVSPNDFAIIIDRSDKKRFEIRAGRIRALYGHSVPTKISKVAETPPAIIFHGTARHLLERILENGLQPMGRQYVHLSTDEETAIVVGKRKDVSPVLLCIDSEKAWEEGIKFYKGNHTIWLADHVPPNYIAVK